MDEPGGRLHRMESIGGHDLPAQVNLPQHLGGHRHFIRLSPHLGLGCEDTVLRGGPGQRRQQMPLVTFGVLRTPDGLAVQPDRH
jgi:hypothetical protein